MAIKLGEEMNECYANIIVDISHEKLDKIFQFRIPKELENCVKAGMVVEFPFGAGNRITKGFVVGITKECDYPKEKIKSILRIVEKEMGMEREFILLAEFISKNYGSTMLQALNTVVPVLIEGISEKDPNKVFGYTDTMKLVNVINAQDKIGQIIDVKITEAKSFSLDGEAV